MGRLGIYPPTTFFPYNLHLKEGVPSHRAGLSDGAHFCLARRDIRRNSELLFLGSQLSLPCLGLPLCSRSPERGSH